MRWCIIYKVLEYVGSACCARTVYVNFVHDSYLCVLMQRVGGIA